MLNKIILVGRITRDLELKQIPGSGNSVVNFSIASSRPFSKEDITDFINCTAWNRTAENMVKFLGKGSLVAIDGRLQSSTYEAKDGSKRYTMDVNCENVHFLESQSKNPNLNKEETTQKNLVDIDKELGKTTTVEITEDDLPW